MNGNTLVRVFSTVGLLYVLLVPSKSKNDLHSSYWVAKFSFTLIDKLAPLRLIWFKFQLIKFRGFACYLILGLMLGWNTRDVIHLCKFSNEIIFHHFSCVTWMADILKSLRCVIAGMFDQNLFTSGMLKSRQNHPSKLCSIDKPSDNLEQKYTVLNIALCRNDRLGTCQN